MSNVKDCAEKDGQKVPSETAKEIIVCPVCGKEVYLHDLPDKNSAVTDNLYSEGGILIVDSEIMIHCEFDHKHDGQGNALDDPHGLIAVVIIEFNMAGKCFLFDIVEIIPVKGGD